VSRRSSECLPRISGTAGARDRWIWIFIKTKKNSGQHGQILATLTAKRNSRTRSREEIERIQRQRCVARQFRAYSREIKAGKTRSGIPGSLQTLEKLGENNSRLDEKLVAQISLLPLKRWIPCCSHQPPCFYPLFVNVPRSLVTTELRFACNAHLAGAISDKPAGWS